MPGFTGGGAILYSPHQSLRDTDGQVAVPSARATGGCARQTPPERGSKKFLQLAHISAMAPLASRCMGKTTSQ
jgi:hypothetical protein